MNTITVRSDHISDTRRLGALLGAALPAGSVVALNGSLGAGKTALSRAVLEARGFTDGFCSPSYTIMNEYESGSKRAYHFDMYRIDDPAELAYAGYYDCLGEGDITIIEWAEKIEDYLPQNAVLIRISLLKEENAREIVVQAQTALLSGIERAYYENSCD